MKKSLILGSLLMACLSVSIFSCHSSSEEEPEYINTFHFREPLTSWSATPDAVEQYMSGYSLVSSSPYSLVYEGRDSETSYLYAFSSLSGTLTYAVVTFLPDQKSEAILFLEQHYTRHSEQDGALVFSDDASSTTITATSDPSTFRLTYMSNAYMAR